MLQAALAGLGCSGAVALLTWWASVRVGDAGVADRAWSFCIATAASAYAVLLPGDGTRAAAMMALVWAWALRLSFHLARRQRGQPEDRRYAAMRAQHGTRFPVRSLYLVFGLQCLLAWVVTAPLLAGLAAVRPWGAMDTAGAALAAFGIAFETVADVQLARFRAVPDHRHRVMDRGLWAWSRHPNYFGEACVWWGLWLMALQAGGAWSVVSPLLMTALLLRVSGVTLLEKDIAERRPAYAEYVRRTNAFLPGPRRHGPCR